MFDEFETTLMSWLPLQAKACKKCKSTGSITCPGCKVSSHLPNNSNFQDLRNRAVGWHAGASNSSLWYERS